MLKDLFNTGNNNPPRPNNLQGFHLMTLPTNHFLFSATRNVFASVMGQDRVSEQEFGFLSTGERLRFDFGSKFGLGGLGISGGGKAVIIADQRIPCK